MFFAVYRSAWGMLCVFCCAWQRLGGALRSLLCMAALGECILFCCCVWQRLEDACLLLGVCGAAKYMEGLSHLPEVAVAAVQDLY